MVKSQKMVIIQVIFNSLVTVKNISVKSENVQMLKISYFGKTDYFNKH